MRRHRKFAATLIALILPLASCQGPGSSGDATPIADTEDARPTLGLVTSLPIYWSEGDFRAMLDDNVENHWVRQTLEQEYRLVPLDSLSQDDGTPSEGLADLDRLIVAQPRALTAADNVALDEWVRGGGRLLLVIDPRLTGHSRYAIGDPRRPSDVGLAPPLFARWGLVMSDDAASFAAPGQRDWDGLAIPVNRAGRLTATSAQTNADCAIEAQGLVADCDIGRGGAVIVGDADWLDEDAEPGSGAVIERMIERAFP